MLSLEDKWEQLSSAIQQSNQGIFSASVELKRSDGSIFQVDIVSGVVVSNMTLLLIICKDDQAATFSSKSLLTRPVVAENTCQVSEPTVHIVGENNSCMTINEVASGYIPVLKNCADSGDYQFWTFRNDKMITYASTDLCLETYDFPGDSLSLHECNDAMHKCQITNWNMRDDGSIVTPLLERAFTAETIITNPLLTLDNISYSISQSWVATNSSLKPFLMTIVVRDTEFCLTTNQYSNLWVKNCLPETNMQKWLIYSDGSIRPELNHFSCVTCLGNEEGSQVHILPCAHWSTTQRWVFQNDGSLKNLKNGFVIKAASTSQLVLSKYEGDYNQLWLPLI